MQFQDSTPQTPIQNPNYPSSSINYPHCYSTNHQSHHMKPSLLLSPVDAAPATHHDHLRSCFRKSHHDDDDEPQKQQKKDSAAAVAAEALLVHKIEAGEEEEEEEKRSSGGPRERLKRHRAEVASSSSDGVWMIPDIWGQEGFLKDWSDCATFDASLVAATIANARDSLIEESKRIRRPSSAILPSSTINNSSSNNNSPSRVLLRVNSSS